MWERQRTDERQAVTVDASGGSFRLTFHSQPSTGTGTLVNGSNIVSSLAGSFVDGQTIAGIGIPVGTKIVEVRNNGTMMLSQNATADGDQTLTASVDATTAPLPFDASALQLHSALEALSGIGVGNVTVIGGPGDAGGTSPYVVTFVGALSGVDVTQLSADGGGLSGAGAVVDTTRPLHNLTLLASLPASQNTGVLGASADGHRLYFIGGNGQLVPGGPTVNENGIYAWQDADGMPGGTIAFVGEMHPNDVKTNINSSGISIPRVSRVTSDGRFLLFEASIGDGFRPRNDQTGCSGGNATNNGSGGCSEVYVYKADSSTPTDPAVACASCAPSGVPESANAFVNIRVGAGGSGPTSHLSRALSDDGRRAFFWTAESLVPEDTNGRADVYEYDVQTRTAHLISSGKDPSDSYFLDADADGHDVYFITRQRLVGWDTDTAYDIYDARIGGGFPDPPAIPRECGGDACQGQAPASPVAPTLGSALFRGLGDVVPLRGSTRRRAVVVRCKHGRVKRTVHGRVRCLVKRRASRHARTKHRRSQ
jgi:hypothetical protein